MTVIAKEPIDKLWYTRCPVPTPLGLASQLGWFLEEFQEDGIGVFTLQETEDAAVRESHYDHHLVNSFRQGGNVPAIWARSRSAGSGHSTRVIGLNWVNEYQGIVALPGSGIQSPKDLKGRRLALPVAGNTIDHARAGALRAYLVALETAGLSHRDVEFVDVATHQTLPLDNELRALGGYGAVLGALRAGTVDAAYVKGARGLSATDEIGANIVYDVRKHPDPLVRANNGAPRPITVDETLLRNRPDIVKRFLARIVDIGDWAASHPAETAAYVARETRSSAEWVRKAYGNDLHLHQGTDLGETSIAALNAYKNFLFEWNFIPKDFDTRAWIEPSILTDIHRHRNIKLA